MSPSLSGARPDVREEGGSAAPLAREGPPCAAADAGATRGLAPLRRAIAEAATRAGRSRVHAVLSPVAQPLTANVAAALRIDVSMTVDEHEIGAMAAGSDALLINLGMLDAERRAGILAAVRTGRPFVLDPVKVDRSPERLAFAHELIRCAPKVVKGNAAEMAALGHLPEGTVAVTTGAVDTIARGRRTLRLANGTPLLDRVIATGCATGLLIAAGLAREDPLIAAAAGLSQMTIAAECAAETSPGPGSFAVRLIDELARLDAARIEARLSILPAPFDLRLYLILGPDVTEVLALAQAAEAGGVTLIQWRDKAGSTAGQVAMVRALRERLAVPVIVNDRADVARAAGADGLHVGHGDLPPRQAGDIAAAPVGVTIHAMAEADALAGEPYAYASVGGVFQTTSKHNPSPPIGIDGFAAIARRVKAERDVPVCAIAGIDAERAHALVGAGADGVAVMSAITKAKDPQAAARELRQAVEAARR